MLAQTWLPRGDCNGEMLSHFKSSHPAPILLPSPFPTALSAHRQVHSRSHVLRVMPRFRPPHAYRATRRVMRSSAGVKSLQVLSLTCLKSLFLLAKTVLHILQRYFSSYFSVKIILPSGSESESESESESGLGLVAVFLMSAVSTKIFSRFFEGLLESQKKGSHQLQ